MECNDSTGFRRDLAAPWVAGLNPMASGSTYSDLRYDAITAGVVSFTSASTRRAASGGIPRVAKAKNFDTLGSPSRSIAAAHLAICDRDAGSPAYAASITTSLCTRSGMRP
nr:hypothetical protein [Microbacterium sp. C5A9]